MLYSCFCAGGCWCLQTFLVRKCSSSQRKVLCLRVTADKSASSVKECFICEEDSSEYKTHYINMCFPPAGYSRAHFSVRCGSLTLTGWMSAGQRGFGAAVFPVKFEQVSHCLHSCQSNSVCSITSFRLGELSTQLPWSVSTGGLLLYQQVMYYFNRHTVWPKVCRHPCPWHFLGGAVFHGLPRSSTLVWDQISSARLQNRIE